VGGRGVLFLVRTQDAPCASRDLNPLQERIAALIAASGPITVAQYMTIALHDPDYGYYSKAEPIGARGDFITAPEISQMFGELIGLWCAQVWLDQGKRAETAPC